MSDEKRVRRELLFSGHVQGVGFRYTVRSVAARHPVVGYVKNLIDGRVQLIVEGEANEVRKFLDEIDFALGPYIFDVQSQEIIAAEPFTDFRIRF